MFRRFAAVILSAILLSPGWLGMTGMTLLIGFVPLLWVSASYDDTCRSWWGMFGWATLAFVLWNALTIWSDIWNGEWETDDLNDAIGILKADPDAVIVNGYYCGHFGEDMTIDEIAAGIRWHYEGGHNRLADYCEVTQGRDALEEGRKAAEAAGLPFCERLADGGDDELSPYVYDGSMALADHEKMQQAREAFDRLADALREIAAKLAEAMKPVINAVLSAFKKLWKVSVRAIGVPPKWLHLAAHAKKARTRKKYRNRIRRYVFEALAAEGGGGP